MNRRTLKDMQAALNRGGQLLWIAPSGGRDRTISPENGAVCGGGTASLDGTPSQYGVSGRVGWGWMIQVLTHGGK